MVAAAADITTPEAVEKLTLAMNNFERMLKAFTADFLKRHQYKLIFGSDCGCVDGRGSGA